MVDILHKVGIKSSSLVAVYRALTTLDGFPAGGPPTPRAKQGRRRAAVSLWRRRFRHEGFGARSDRHVLWQVVDGPAEWIGTKVGFDLRQEGDWTILFFKHQGWKEPVEFMHHCSTKWAVFLLSLKALVETARAPPGRTKSSSTAGSKAVTVPRAQRVAVFPGPNRPGRETKAEPRRPGENVVSVLEIRNMLKTSPSGSKATAESP